MLFAAREQVDARRIDGAVPQHVRQLDDILAHPVELDGEQVPQVVGEHLLRRDARLRAQRLELLPNAVAGQRRAGFACEVTSLYNAVFLRVFEQLLLQLQFLFEEHQ